MVGSRGAFALEVLSSGREREREQRDVICEL